MEEGAFIDTYPIGSAYVMVDEWFGLYATNENLPPNIVSITSQSLAFLYVKCFCCSETGSLLQNAVAIQKLLDGS